MRKIFIFSLLFFLMWTFLLSQAYQGKGKIKGFVYSEDGKPLEGVRVKLYSLKASSGFEVFTDKNGEWKALWIRGGIWYVDFIKAGYEPKKISIKIKEREKNPIIEIKLKKIKGLILTPELKKDLETGNKLYDEKKYEQAIEVYKNLLQKYPDAYIVNLNIGNCYFQMEKYDEAEKYYKKIIEINPENPDALIAIGNCYLNRGQKEEAIKWYNKISFEKIKNPTVLYNLGNNFYENSQFNEALKYYKKAIELDENFLEARYQLGLTYIALGKYKEALIEFENYLNYDSESSKAEQVKNFIEYLKKELAKIKEN